MAKKIKPKALPSPPPRPVAATVGGKFVSHRDANMRAQHFLFDADQFDSSVRDDLIALETLLALNRVARIEEEF